MFISLLFIAGIAAIISLFVGAWAAPNFRNAVKGFWKKNGKKIFKALCALTLILLAYITMTLFIAYHGLTHYNRFYIFIAMMMVLIPGIMSMMAANKGHQALKKSKVIQAINNFLQSSDNEALAEIKLTKRDLDLLQSNMAGLSLYFFFLTVMFFFALIDPEFAMKSNVLLGVGAFVTLCLFFWGVGIYRGWITFAPATFFTVIFMLELAYLGFTFTSTWQRWRYNNEIRQELAVALYDFHLLNRKMEKTTIKVTAGDTVLVIGAYHEKYAKQKTYWVVTRNNQYIDKHIPIYDEDEGILPITCLRPTGRKDVKKEGGEEIVQVPTDSTTKVGSTPTFSNDEVDFSEVTVVHYKLSGRLKQALENGTVVWMKTNISNPAALNRVGPNGEGEVEFHLQGCQQVTFETADQRTLGVLLKRRSNFLSIDLEELRGTSEVQNYLGRKRA